MISLNNGLFRAEIVPEIGANITLLRHIASNTALVREVTDWEEFRRVPEQYGIPVLFPPNRIEDGKFTFQGRSYYLPVTEVERNNHLHGLVFRKAWKTHSISSTAAELCFTFDETALEYEGFPFPFTLTRKVSLTETGLIDEMTVANNGVNDMPLGLGYHTTFSSVNAQVRISADAGEIEVDSRYLPTGKTLPWRDIDPRQEFAPVGRFVGFHCNNVLDEGGFCGAILRYPTGTLRYITDPKFGFWYTWNKRGLGDFVSLEPVSWMANALNRPEPAEETGIRILSPQNQAVFRNELQFKERNK